MSLSILGNVERENNRFFSENIWKVVIILKRTNICFDIDFESLKLVEFVIYKYGDISIIRVYFDSLG